MKFNQSVDVNEVLTVLKDAAQQNKFGDYKVDPNSIKQIASSSTVTPSTQGRVKSNSNLVQSCINLGV